MSSCARWTRQPGLSKMDEKWVRYYDEFATRYHTPAAQSGYVANDVPLGEGVFDDWVGAIQQRLAVSSQHTLLDVGCGAGVFLKRFARYTPLLYGVDPSAAQIENARTNCPTAQLRVGSATDARFEGIRFDRIVCNSVFLCFASMAHARETIAHFVAISSEEAKFWIGDLPFPTSEMAEGSGYRRTGLTTKLGTQHYPLAFMYEICEELRLRGSHFPQTVDKPSAAFRYDFLIEKT